MNTNSKIYYFLQKKFFAVFISASVCPTKRREKEESLALTDWKPNGEKPRVKNEYRLPCGIIVIKENVLDVPEKFNIYIPLIWIFKFKSQTLFLYIPKRNTKIDKKDSKSPLILHGLPCSVACRGRWGRWQRTGDSRPPPTAGTAGPAETAPATPRRAEGEPCRIARPLWADPKVPVWQLIHV